MSTQRGNVKRGAPKHQNSFAFKHNPKSKLTKKILESSVHGLCSRCHEQIMWRKKYRKYKPLTHLATCKICHLKAINAAYHEACDPCAKERGICAKCMKSGEIILSEQNDDSLTETAGLSLEGLREREKRTILRKAEKKSVKSKLDNEDGESFDESSEEFLMSDN